jgi:hypothetical protein
MKLLMFISQKTHRSYYKVNYATDIQDTMGTGSFPGGGGYSGRGRDVDHPSHPHI